MESKIKIISSGILSLMAALLLLTDCSKESPMRTGFDITLYEESQGLTFVGIHAQAVSLTLEGWITADTGEIKVELLDQQGYMVYGKYFPAPGTYRISETFKAHTGNWTLRYQSLEARGNLTLYVMVKEY